jgi:ABC-type sugar transport system ATPase subunit
VPADRKRQGLVLGRSFGENLLMASQSQAFRLRPPRRKRELVTIEAATKQLQIRAASPDVAAGTLSGGNQQKVLLGKWLETKPRLLMLDEPTRGVDVGARTEIYRIMRELAARGVAILMISSELPEVVGMSDRAYVMREGVVSGVLEPGEITEEAVVRLATQHRLAA